MKTTRAPKSLRGSKLTELALRDLSDLSLWTDPNPPLTWANLATRVGGSDFIVIRNVRDYRGSPVPIRTPHQFLVEERKS